MSDLAGVRLQTAKPTSTPRSSALLAPGHPIWGWRKRVGVEPTRNRQTTPSGFEVRTSHRGPRLFLSYSHRFWPREMATVSGKLWSPLLRHDVRSQPGACTERGQNIQAA